MCIACFNIHNLGTLYFLPLKKLSAIIHQNSTTRLTLLMAFHCVFCGVGTEVLNMMLMKRISGYSCLMLATMDPVFLCDYLVIKIQLYRIVISQITITASF